MYWLIVSLAIMSFVATDDHRKEAIKAGCVPPEGKGGLIPLVKEKPDIPVSNVPSVEAQKRVSKCPFGFG